MGRYGKLLWAVLGAVVFFIQAAVRDGMTPEEWVGTALAGVNAVVVWAATDTTVAPWVKSAVGGLLAGLLVLETAVLGGITAEEWFAIAVAVLTGLGVIVDPRRPVHVVDDGRVVDGPVAPTTPRPAY